MEGDEVVCRHYIRMPTNLMMVVCKIQASVKEESNKKGFNGQTTEKGGPCLEPLRKITFFCMIYAKKPEPHKNP